MSAEIFRAHFVYIPLSLNTKYQSFIYGKFILQKRVNITIAKTPKTTKQDKNKEDDSKSLLSHLLCLGLNKKRIFSQPHNIQ